MVDLTSVKKASGWPAARATMEKAVMDVLQSVPKERAELQVKLIDEIEFPGYVRRRVNYFVDPWERATAWLFVPEGRDETPALLCCHGMAAAGKDECAGLEGDPVLALAQRYAEKGYVTIAPDCITMGGRVSSGLEPFDTKSFYKDNPSMSAVGKMLVDHMHAIDVLCETRWVDPARIGVIGHGFGGMNALWLAAFDERVQACVASCAFTRFSDDKDAERWARNDGFVFLPMLRQHVKTRKFPFDWEHILALIAPSPTLLITALNDEELPKTKGCVKAVESVRQIYRLLGASEALQHVTHEDGHRLTRETIEAADDWLDRWL